MNMTERIYEHDSYCRRFTATVEACTEENGVYSVVLNRTAFFPEGGGQGADGGTINGIEVADVQRVEDTVFHKIASPVTVGSEVECEIDWETRFSRMQSHAGEHVLSGIVYKLFGYANVGFHMSENYLMTVDFSGALLAEDIEKVELLANRAIYENGAITVSFPADDELENLDFRSKTEHKDTRLVTIENVDCCACCAPHPSRTGEIGIIKVISFCPYKQGTRIEMVAGVSALEDYFALSTSNKALMGLLSASRYNVKEAVEKQFELVQSLKAENQKLSRKLALSELSPVEVNGSAYAVFDGMSYDDLRVCSNALAEKDYKICVLLSKADGENYLYVVSSKDEDVRPFVQAMNSAFGGKGGGKPDYAQGRISAYSEEELKKML